MGEISKLGVVGGGLMGSGIAEVAARAGVETVVTELNADFAAAAEKRLRGAIEKSVAKGKTTQEDADAILGRVSFADNLDALADVDLVIEAAVENEAAKKEVFARLGQITKDDAILASNTSSLQIVRLGAASGRPSKTVGLHFFSPVPIMKLVEVIPSLATAPETVEVAQAFVAEKMGKKVILAPDRPGFVVNAILVPYMFAAMRMLEGGYATAKDIDTGMMLGCGHPMGPLALCDVIGLETVKAAGEGMYNEFKDPAYAPPPMLNRLVDAGFVGRKAGRGFHDYSNG